MVRLYNRDWNRQDLIRYVGHIDQVAGIKPMQGADGMEQRLPDYSGLDGQRFDL